jgi:transmembrane sensor
MSAPLDRAIVEQAVAWHLRLQDADEDAWIQFAAWLDADPAHNGAYEAVADRDARVSAVLDRATFPPSDDHERPTESSIHEAGNANGVIGASAHRNLWRWGALAASIAVAGFSAVEILSDRHAPYAIETSAGETRTPRLSSTRMTPDWWRSPEAKPDLR